MRNTVKAPFTNSKAMKINIALISCTICYVLMTTGVAFAELETVQSGSSLSIKDGPLLADVRTDDWKYMRYPHGDGSPDRHMAELYHIKTDPMESRNLINNPKYAKIITELQAQLASLITASGAVPDKMPMDEGIKTFLPDESIR